MNKDLRSTENTESTAALFRPVQSTEDMYEKLAVVYLTRDGKFTNTYTDGCTLVSSRVFPQNARVPKSAVAALEDKRDKMRKYAKEALRKQCKLYNTEAVLLEHDVEIQGFEEIRDDLFEMLYSKPSLFIMRKFSITWTRLYFQIV